MVSRVMPSFRNSNIHAILISFDKAWKGSMLTIVSKSSHFVMILMYDNGLKQGKLIGLYLFH